MILPPNRLVDVIAAVEAGEPVDAGKVSTLLALDAAQLGRQAVEEAIKRDEEANEHLSNELDRVGGRPTG
jgi:hypothetical protein